jgi:hypothetical protein
MSEIPGSLLPEQVPVTSQAPQVPQQTVAPETQSPLQTQLLQVSTNKVLPVDQAELDIAIRSGLYAPKNDQEFIVLDKYGNRNRVLGADLKSTLDDGYKLETPEELQARVMQEQHGDSTVAAGIEGVARGALAIPALASQAVGAIPGLESLAFTPDEAIQGLSNLTGDNFTSEQLQGRAEANPVASTVGNVLGTIGSGGAVGIPKLVAGTEKLVAKNVLKDAAKAGLGKRIAAKLATKAAGGAVEGAYFGAGDLMSEASLGKADVNAENLLAYMGMGAVLGGGLSAGTSALVDTVKAAAPFGKMITQPFTSKISNSLDAKVASGRLMGLSPTQLAKLEKRNPGLVRDMQSFLKDDLELSFADTAEDLALKNSKLADEAGGRIGGVLDEIDNVLNASPELKPSAKEVWGNVYNKVYTKFEDILSDVTGPGAAKTRKELTKFLDEVYALEKSGAEFKVSDLQAIKKSQDKLLNYAKEPGKWTAYQDMVYATRTALKEEIDSLATKLESFGMVPDLAKQLKAANRQYSAAASFGDFIENRALKAADRDFSFMNTVRESALDVSRKLVVLGKIERAAQKMDRLSTKAIEGFVKPAGRAADNVVKKAVVPFTIMESEFGKKFEDGKYKKPKSVAEAYVNLQDNMARYGQDPMQFMNRVNRNTASIYNSAPETSQALDTLGVQAAMFLSTKLPKRTSNPGIQGLLKVPRPPSKLDLSKLERTLKAIENPTSVYEDLEAGKLSSESAEVIRNVYPNMFAKLQEKAMQLVASKPNMAYSKRLQLGLLLDVPTDESLLPENVIGLQSSFEAQASDAGGAVNPTQAGVKNINPSERYETDTQDSEI